MEPIQVRTQDRLPNAFRWRRRLYLIEQILESWVYRGKWWTDAELKGERRVYYRLLSRRGTYEVFRSSRHGWVLSRVQD